MAAPRRRGGRTEKGEQVATSILDAAIEAIADEGASVSMQRIADRASVDKRVLAYYFGDREGLVAATADRLGERLVGTVEVALADVVDPDVGFAIGFEVLWGTVTENPRLHAAHLSLVAASIGDEPLRRRVAAIRDRYDRLIQDRATVAEGEGWSGRTRSCARPPSATRSPPFARRRASAAARWSATASRPAASTPTTAACSVSGSWPRTGGAGAARARPRCDRAAPRVPLAVGPVHLPPVPPRPARAPDDDPRNVPAVERADRAGGARGLAAHAAFDFCPPDR